MLLARRLGWLMILYLASVFAGGALAGPGDMDRLQGAATETPAPGLEVRARAEAHRVLFDVSSAAPLRYALARPRRDLCVVDFPGVTPVAPETARVLPSPIVSSYRVLESMAEGRPATRLEILVRVPIEPRLDLQNPRRLLLTFSDDEALPQAKPQQTAAGPSSPAVEPSAQASVSIPRAAALPAPSAPSPTPAAAPAGAPKPKASSPSGAGAASAAKPDEARFAGEPISLDLKDVDLKDFFRLIHEVSGLNVVVDPNVKGTLTIDLNDVPWDQALDIVLRDNSLAEQLQGNVLRIATSSTLKREADEKRELEKAQEQAVPVVTVTRVLSYAKAAALRDTLKQFLSPRGEILADQRSNMVIIRDIPSVLPVMDKLIKQLDRKSQQVEIEARVVVANRSFAREIGTQFGFAVAGATGNIRNVFGGAASVGQSPVVRTIEPPPPLVSTSGGISIPGVPGQPIPLNSNLGAAAPTSGITFAHTEPNLALDVVLTAAESKGVGRLLSKPRLITQNNEKALVKQGTKIPVQTIVNNTISVQFVDAVLQLEVTPQITADGNVFMDVKVENTAIDPAIPRIMGIPALDTQGEETKVLIGDGGTVVIGGIIVSQQQTAISQVPLFGSIPVIGHLFKHTAVSTQSQELLFFLTPRILPS
jgi:type IV pilus assembly protein PilQ